MFRCGVAQVSACLTRYATKKVLIQGSCGVSIFGFNVSLDFRVKKCQYFQCKAGVCQYFHQMVGNEGLIQSGKEDIAFLYHERSLTLGYSIP